MNTATPNLADLLAQRVFYMKDLLPARVTISFKHLILARKKNPRVSRVLGKSELSGLAVKLLTWNVRDMGLNPNWFQLSQLR